VVDFVGADPDSPEDECPAVLVDPVTGDFYFRGKTVTDPALVAEFGEHVAKGGDESDVWLPARMAPIIREALDGYEQGRRGPGQPSFETLVAHARRSVARLEMRDSYEAEPLFQEWQKTGVPRYDWTRWEKLVGDAVVRGVKFRRVRIVSEPVSAYIRWEHSITDGNIRAGEEVRWLPRRLAWDLMLPGADFFMFDQRLVRFGFCNGDGVSTRRYEFSSDPRTVTQCVASLEMVWERAIPHEDYEV
jgi:hypothetical protein